MQNQIEIIREKHHGEERLPFVFVEQEDLTPPQPPLNFITEFLDDAEEIICIATQSLAFEDNLCEKIAEKAQQGVRVYLITPSQEDPKFYQLPVLAHLGVEFDGEFCIVDNSKLAWGDLSIELYNFETTDDDLVKEYKNFFSYLFFNEAKKRYINGQSEPHDPKTIDFHAPLLYSYFEKAQLMQDIASFPNYAITNSLNIKHLLDNSQDIFLGSDYDLKDIPSIDPNKNVCINIETIKNKLLNVVLESNSAYFFPKILKENKKFFAIYRAEDPTIVEDVKNSYPYKLHRNSTLLESQDKVLWWGKSVEIKQEETIDLGEIESESFEQYKSEDFDSLVHDKMKFDVSNPIIDATYTATILPPQLPAGSDLHEVYQEWDHYKSKCIEKVEELISILDKSNDKQGKIQQFFTQVFMGKEQKKKELKDKLELLKEQLNNDELPSTKLKEIGVEIQNHIKKVSDFNKEMLDLNQEAIQKEQFDKAKNNLENKCEQEKQELSKLEDTLKQLQQTQQESGDSKQTDTSSEGKGE